MSNYEVTLFVKVCREINTEFHGKELHTAVTMSDRALWSGLKVKDISGTSAGEKHRI